MTRACESVIEVTSKFRAMGCSKITENLCAISPIVWPFIQEHLRPYLTKCWLPGESLATTQISEQSKKQGEIHGAEIQSQGEQPCRLSVLLQPISQAGHQVKNTLRCEQHSIFGLYGQQNTAEKRNGGQQARRRFRRASSPAGFPGFSRPIHTPNREVQLLGQCLE